LRYDFRAKCRRVQEHQMAQRPEPVFDASVPVCPRCLKPKPLCICDEVQPIANRTGLLILQHPQEQDRLLGTARVAVQQFADATLRVGLSWPSLAKVLGRPADPKRWATLFLGATRAADFPPGREVAAFDRKGAAIADQDAALAHIQGVILLDGTWSQAKTLWWRNAWLLKGQRLALKPRRPSLYGQRRREARREGLSTIEAAGLVLARLEGRPEIEAAVATTFRTMLARYDAAAEAAAEASAARAS
jgi:DTW domain-containing protein YfiP